MTHFQTRLILRFLWGQWLMFIATPTQPKGKKNYKLIQILIWYFYLNLPRCEDIFYFTLYFKQLK